MILVVASGARGARAFAWDAQTEEYRLFQILNMSDGSSDADAVGVCVSKVAQGRIFVIVGNGGPFNSTAYEWVGGSFKFSHAIPGGGYAGRCASFSAGTMRLVAIPRLRNATSYDAMSSILRWDDGAGQGQGRFVLHQNIETHGAVDASVASIFGSLLVLSFANSVGTHEGLTATTRDFQVVGSSLGSGKL